jgi:hypothetical protein
MLMDRDSPPGASAANTPDPVSGNRLMMMGIGSVFWYLVLTLGKEWR